MLVRRLRASPAAALARRGAQVSQRLLRTSALSASSSSSSSVRGSGKKAAAASFGSLRAHLPGRRNVCAHGFHSCASCANTKSGDGAGDAAAIAPEALFDFSSKEEVKVTVASNTEEESTAPVGLPHMVAKAEAERANEEALQFGSEPALPAHLYNHLHSIDLFVKPQELDPAQLAELKAKILAINQKIRSELNMQPARFYREHYRAREERIKPGVMLKGGSHVPHTDFHPLKSGESASEEAPVSDNFLRSQGLNSEPNQEMFDLLSHSLPKPLKKRQPCLFCSPPRDHPAEYYRLDYTNVNILHRFLNERGAITSARYNFNCRKHQRRVAEAVKRARFIGLLSFTNLYHVPRDFMNAPDPRPGDDAAEAAASLQSEVWGHSYTAATIPTGNMKMSDSKFWTQEGSDELGGPTARVRRPSRLRTSTATAAATTGAADAAATGASENGAVAAADAADAPKKIRDPFAL